ncbi:type II/IV secretion system protein [bacterium]|nr:type II/IV secretion system protein [bacterium]
MLKKYDFDKMPVVEIVNDILLDSSKKGASDIHFDPYEDYMKIRIRIDGALSDYAEIPNSIKKNLVTRVKILAGMNITESRLPQDGAIKINLQGTGLDLRVSCLPTINGEKIVIRILDYSMSTSGLESLGFSEKNYEKISKMINLPNGIILVTGATGSGKSTTVYAILQKLNKEDTNIITVEDPIEMNIEGVNQVQTNSEIGLTFATALRSILRQDPNVIMIGEIRDTETAKIAVRASITGHIVLSTIHTNNSLNTIERLLDMDVERYLLASALTGIVSQKLARRLCPKCRAKKKTNEYEKQLFKKVLHKDVEEIWTTEGCEECGNGYSGRIAIQEVLLVNQEIKDAISSNLPKEQLRHLVYSADVTTLLQDGLEKVVEGYTTFEEILKLIELDNDDPKESKFDLKTALNFTKISQESGSSITEPKVTSTETIIEPKEEVKQENETPIEEPKVEEKQDSFSDWKMPTEEPKEEKVEIKEESKPEKKLEPTYDDDDDDLMNMEF